MYIYHGSTKIIEKPQYGYGKVYNDYGLGFYCTENIELAKEWSCSLMQDGYVNKYKIEIKSLSVLDLTKGYHILNWLAILLENRTFDGLSELGYKGKEYILKEFLPKYRDYDVIVGYRADDSYFQFAKDFIQGAISLNTLSKAMKLGKLGEQIVLISKKSFEILEFCGYEISSYEEYYYRRKIRDQKAREDYKFHLKHSLLQENDIFIIDILRQEMKNNDQRLQ